MRKWMVAMSMDKWMTAMVVAMMLLVPYAAAQSAQPQMSGLPRDVPSDVQKKAEYYSSTQFEKFTGFPQKGGFDLNEFFQYSNKNEFKLSGVTISKTTVEDFRTGKDNQFSFRTKQALDLISVKGKGGKDQRFSNIPSGSTVSWNGEVLVVKLPEVKGAGKAVSQEVTVKGESNLKFEQQKDGKILVSGSVKGTAKVGDWFIQGDGLKIDLQTNEVQAAKGTIAQNAKVGRLQFKDEGRIKLGEGKIGFETGTYQFVTSAGRKLEVAGTGEYTAQSEQFSFSKNGRVKDVELGVTGIQQDPGKLFTVSLRPDSKINGNGLVVSREAGAGRGTMPDIKEKKVQLNMFNEMLSVPNELPKGVVDILKDSIKTGNKITPIQKVEIGAYLMGSGKLGLKDKIESVAPLFDASKEGSIAKMAKSRLTAAQIFERLEKEGSPAIAAFKEIFPAGSYNKVMDIVRRYSTPAGGTGGDVAKVVTSGTLDVLFTNDKGNEVPIQVKGGSIDQQVSSDVRSRFLPIKISSSEYPKSVFSIGGQGTINDDATLKIPSISWGAAVSQASAVPAPTTRPALAITDPAIQAQQSADAEAARMLPKTAGEKLLDLRVARAFENWNDEDPASTKKYEDYLKFIKATHPGLEIDEENGVITSFGKKAAQDPHAQLQDKAGKPRSDLHRELFLSNPLIQKQIDEVLPQAVKAVKAPGSMTIAEAAEVGKRASRLLGSREDAALVLASQFPSPDVSKLSPVLDVLKDPKMVKALLEGGGSDGAGLSGLAGASAGLGSVFSDVVGGLKAKLAVGAPLSSEEIQMLNFLKTDSAGALLQKVQSMDTRGTFKTELSKAQNFRRLVMSADLDGLSRSNPFGLVNLAESSSMLAAAGLPSSVRFDDAVMAGVLVNTRPSQSSALGLVALRHLGMDKGNTLIVESMDGVGKVAVTFDGNRASYQDITDPSKFKGLDAVRIDFSKVTPKAGLSPEMLRDLSAIKTPEVQNALIRASLSVIGNTPFESVVNLEELYRRGGLDIPGIGSQAVRQMFGAKNEIDATRVLAPSNLVRLSERYNYDTNKVLQEVHRVTDRRGIDPLVVQFVNELRSQRKGGK